jgi:hypothetical protein
MFHPEKTAKDIPIDRNADRVQGTAAGGIEVPRPRGPEEL